MRFPNRLDDDILVEQIVNGLRHGAPHEDDDLDPAEIIATIHRMRTGAA